VVSYGQCDQRLGSFDLSRASSSAHEFDPYFTERSGTILRRLLCCQALFLINFQVSHSDL
jgi:hypothetical protein